MIKASLGRGPTDQLTDQLNGKGVQYRGGSVQLMGGGVGRGHLSWGLLLVSQQLILLGFQR